MEERTRWKLCLLCPTYDRSEKCVIFKTLFFSKADQNLTFGIIWGVASRRSVLIGLSNILIPRTLRFYLRALRKYYCIYIDGVWARSFRTICSNMTSPVNYEFSISSPVICFESRPNFDVLVEANYPKKLDFGFFVFTTGTLLSNIWQKTWNSVFFPV